MPHFFFLILFVIGDFVWSGLRKNIGDLGFFFFLLVVVVVTVVVIVVVAVADSRSSCGGCCRIFLLV